MSWEEPFQQNWAEPVEDVSHRFRQLVPTFTFLEVAMMMGAFFFIMLIVVVVLELYV